ncbi:MAG: homoserine O-acetyltransferase, partial [Lentisphaeria bacterium]|nr:homoserine O-acetyltransferase [Lentisphaeria bacterium]
LIDHLGIKKLLAVIGGSMGGMQVLEWAVQYPDMMKCVVPIATTSRMSAQGIAFDWIGRDAIQSDPQWHDGNYKEASANPARGLAVARMIAHITYLSDESMTRKFGRNLQNKESYSFNFTHDFAVESYLEYQGKKFVERFDANSYCYITRATDYFDLTAHAGGDLVKALEKVTADFLVVSFSSDWLFPPADSHELVRALLRNRKKVTYSNVQSGYGHDAFLLEVDVLSRMIRDFLANQMQEVNNV